MTETDKKSLYATITMSGFGGQGLMFIGKLLAYSAMKEGRNVTWIPSYGPEMRGGTANCTVVISDEEIGSPVILRPQALIIMNNPSLERFEPQLQSNGLLVLNSSVVTRPTTRKDIKIIAIPANEIAAKVGNERAANMVMLGAYIAYTKVVSEGSILAGLEELFGKKIALLEENKHALEEGINFAHKMFGGVGCLQHR
ncbi:MAG: Ketoisovalerate oxidoreductase subunit VorA [Candidatus Bathyarchaeota archaeon BA1]|nr:MAG: Ketoisovalerate oxidoreductase subunit VorA [Candidatus Bathyarchaeota archaeon BA1]